MIMAFQQIKYFDYMLSATPVLVYSQGFSDPISMSGGGIVVREEGVDPLLRQLQAFSKMPKEDLKTMGQKGRNFVLKISYL